MSVAANQVWRGFNPHTPDQGNSVSIAIGNAIYPSAFNVLPNQSSALNADLLESAEQVSAAPQTIEYRIKANAVWSDGKPITADDFIYLWENSNGTNKAIQTSTTIGYSQVKSVTGGDGGKSVKVVFATPFADWKSLFRSMLPAHFMKTLGNPADAWNKGLAKKLPPAGGPFSIKENRPEEYIEFERNPKWYGKPALLDRLTLRYIQDNQAAIQALGSGEIDVARMEVTRALSGQIKAVPSVKHVLVPTTALSFLNFQHGDAVIKDPAVRKAIATIVQPEKLAESIIGGDVSKLMTNNFIFAPSSKSYTDERPASFGTGDVAAAKRILQDAGYKENGKGLFEKNGQELRFNFVVTPGDELDQLTSVNIQDTLKKIGMGLDIKSVPDTKAFEVLMAGDYSTTLGAYPESDFPVSWFSALYTCKGGYNLGRFCDPAADVLYNDANQALDPTRQTALVKDINKKLWAGVANIPLWMHPLIVATADRVAGVTTAIPGDWSLHDAAKWSVKG